MLPVVFQAMPENYGIQIIYEGETDEKELEKEMDKRKNITDENHTALGHFVCVHYIFSKHFLPTRFSETVKYA